MSGWFIGWPSGDLCYDMGDSNMRISCHSDAYGPEHLTSKEVGQEIKRIVRQDDPMTEILLDLWEMDVL